MILLAEYYEDNAYSEHKVESIKETQLMIETLRKDDDFKEWSLHDKDHKYPKSIACGMSYHDCL